jgi:flavin-dependent dehydrogenase
MKNIPKSCDVVVVGGGPAGSSAAALLAAEGLDIVLFDKFKHPREQVGESVIPQFWKYADRIGVSDKIEKEGFVQKAGGIVVWDGRIQQLSFSKFGYADRLGLHVERDRFDYILLHHAAQCGAQVFEEVLVTGVKFDTTPGPGVMYTDRRDQGNRKGQIICRYVVDASGYSTVIAKQLRARKLVDTEHKYLSLWGYYKDADYLGVDGKRHSQDNLDRVRPVTFVNSYQDGWVWHIVLRDTTSVGLVMNTNKLKGMGKEAQEKYFRETCAQIPYLKDLLEPATFVEGSMRFRPDYSYYSQKVSGDNFFCIGDAGAFVDPIFSQGVVAALYNAMLCAWAITASMKNERRKSFYGKLFASRLYQYYGFSRLLAHGDFGGEGIDSKLVEDLINSMPLNELELAFAAAATTSRSEYVRKMVREADKLDLLGDVFSSQHINTLEDLKLGS